MAHKSRFSLILIIAISCCSIQAVSQDYSSLRLSSTPAVPELERASKLLETDPLGALDVLEEFLKSSSNSYSFEYQSRVYHLTGKANFKLDQMDLAINNYLRALDRGSSSYKIKKKISVTPVDPEIFYDLSIAYGVKEQWQDALDYANRYIDTIDNQNSNPRFWGLLNLGSVLLQSNELNEALEVASKADAMADALADPALKIESKYLVGSIMEQQGKYDQALDYLNQAMLMADSVNYQSKSQDISQAIGRNYNAKDDRQSELSFKSARRSRSIELDDRAQQNSLDLDIAELYIDLEQSDKAVPFLQESVEISEQLGDLESNISARKSLSDVYATDGDYDLALSNYRTYVALVDQLYANKQKEIELTTEIQQDLFSKQETISLLEKDQELQQSEFEIMAKERALQEESLARQRTFIYGLTVLIVVILISAFLLYKNIQKKKLANQLLALKSLRSQMNPHFIFNALNSVNSFISKNDSRQANKYLSDFSRLMRTVMENSQKDFVSLTEEIAVLELYLKLEHFRFQDKFDYDLSIQSNVHTDEFRIPPMLIQPYIENAIWHGLRYKETHGHLSVSMDKTDSDLLLQIKDDGIGRKKSQELKTPNQKTQESTGMKNTENRINLINSTYKSNISCEIEDIAKDSGTIVSVKIPLTLIEETI